MTNWVRGGGTDDQTLGAALGALVAAMGGPARAASSATGAVRAAGGLGEFLGDLSRDGLEVTLDLYGLADLVGGDPLDVLDELASRIAGAGESPEEALARTAVLEVLVRLFEDAENFAAMTEIAVDDALLRELVARFIAEYIFLRVMQELGDRIADNATPAEAERMERAVRDQIRALVDLDLSTIDPVEFEWRGAAGQNRLRELLADALRMVGASE